MPETGDSAIAVTGLLTDTMKDFVYHLNLGMVMVGSTSGIAYGGALDFNVKKDINFVCELSGGSINSVSILGALVGGTWKIKKNMTLDGGIKFGLNDNTPSGFTIGLTTLL